MLLVTFGLLFGLCTILWCVALSICSPIEERETLVVDGAAQ